MPDWMQHTFGYWQSGGWLLAPIALISAGIWGYFLRSRDLLARTIREGSGLADAWARGDIAGDAEAIRHVLERRRDGVGRWLRLAWSDVEQGAAPREAFEARESQCLVLLRRDFVILAALTTAAPLLGLLGTVIGMVFTFDAVAAVSGNTGARVAGGISQALITTQFGLVVALPGIFGMARLERMHRYVEVVLAECRAHALAALVDPAEANAS